MSDVEPTPLPRTMDFPNDLYVDGTKVPHRWALSIEQTTGTLYLWVRTPTWCGAIPLDDGEELHRAIVGMMPAVRHRRFEIQAAQAVSSGDTEAAGEPE